MGWYGTNLPAAFEVSRERERGAAKNHPFDLARRDLRKCRYWECVCGIRGDPLKVKMLFGSCRTTTASSTPPIGVSRRNPPNTVHWFPLLFSSLSPFFSFLPKKKLSRDAFC